MSALVALLLCSSVASVESLAERGLVLLPSASWTPELLEDLSLGLDAVPPGARKLPLEVELHEEVTPLGLGDATRPAMTHELGRLHLYGWREADDPRALARLGRLSSDQRRRLWRRRAVVHALVRRVDARLRWSARAGWKALAGWEGQEALLVYPWAFSRREGMESPALDLATFAEELLVPAESLLPNAVPLDDRLPCREPSKARFLGDRLEAIDPSWKRPRADCPAFEAWADLEHLAKFEVLFATPSAASAQALFGHLLLRLVREDDGDPGASQVMQLAALISPMEPISSYFSRGLSGGFRGVFSLTSLADVQLEALSLEQRSLRRYALTLTVDQRVRLLERVWELERVGYTDYRFFKANCATMLRFLITPALGDAAPGPPLTPWETPTQVLDGLAEVLGAMETDEASSTLARRAKESLSADAKPGEARALLARLRIERAALDAATVARIKAERATVLPGWTGPTTDDLVAARQRRYEHETSPRRRAQWELSALLALDELLRAAPRREFRPSELAVLEEERRARESFDAVADAVGNLPEAELTRAREDERAALRVFEEETSRRTVPEGGLGHAELGLGVLSSGSPALRLRAAALVEQLGDQRQRGFGSRSAWRVLDASAVFRLADQPVERAAFTLINVRSVVASGLGWGFGLDYGFQDTAHEVALGGEGLWVIASDQRLTNFLMVSAGARGGVRIEPVASAVIYPWAGLAWRLQLPGSFGNALRFEGAYLPRVGVRGFEHGVTGLAQLTVRLGVLGVAWTAHAEVQAEWRPITGLTGVATLGLDLD